MSCVFCGSAGVHECAGGRAFSKPDPARFADAYGPVTFFPGRIDGDVISAERYELLHAYSAELLDDWRSQQAHRARWEMP